MKGPPEGHGGRHLSGRRTPRTHHTLALLGTNNYAGAEEELVRSWWKKNHPRTTCARQGTKPAAMTEWKNRRHQRGGWDTSERRKNHWAHRRVVNQQLCRSGRRIGATRGAGWEASKWKRNPPCTPQGGTSSNQAYAFAGEENETNRAGQEGGVTVEEE